MASGAERHSGVDEHAGLPGRGGRVLPRRLHPRSLPDPQRPVMLAPGDAPIQVRHLDRRLRPAQVAGGTFGRFARGEVRDAPPRAGRQRRCSGHQLLLRLLQLHAQRAVLEQLRRENFQVAGRRGEQKRPAHESSGGTPPAPPVKGPRPADPARAARQPGRPRLPPRRCAPRTATRHPRPGRSTRRRRGSRRGRSCAAARWHESR